MGLRVLTLGFDPDRCGFDDGPLRALEREGALKGLRVHLLVHEGRPHLVCTVSVDPAEPRPRAAGERPRASAPRRRTPDPREGLSEEAARRYDAVRAWRTARAREQGLPPYALLTNRQVLAILQAAPADLPALARVAGMSAGWVRLHGEELLAQLASAGEARGEPPLPAGAASGNGSALESTPS